MSKAKVYFSKTITPERVIDMYEAVGKKLEGPIGIKVHSGEKGNQNFLRPDFFHKIVEHLHGRIVECNTAYPGERNYTDKHQKLLIEHKWNPDFDVDIMDAEPKDDVVLDIPNGKVLKKNYVGKNMKNYKSMLVISHFKGHQMGGYGGALKQLSIGFGSTAGKAYIHSAGVTTDQSECWKKLPEQDRFLESMADSAGSIVKYFNGNMVFINVMKNLSTECDCNGQAGPPVMKDIGILASLDPVAIDTACMDLVINSDDPGKSKFLDRVNEKHGTHTIDVANEIGYGTKNYELINLDK